MASKVVTLRQVFQSYKNPAGEAMPCLIIEEAILMSDKYNA